MTKLNIGFAGTPEFALPCLEAIHNSAHSLKIIYTQPDRPAGRGRKIQASAVKLWATAHQIPVLQPVNFKAAPTIAELQALQLDVLVVIAYGLILPRAVLSSPQFGCINVHASMLPRWRGASPIQHALLFGDATSGISIMQMDHGMDTGDILLQNEYAIKPDETAASLHDALAQLAPASLMTILNTLPACIDNARAQSNQHATYAAKISKEDALIDWQDSAETIDRKIRAFNPWPVTYTQYDAISVRIHQAHITPTPSTHLPGTLVSITPEGICVATGSSDLCITQYQFAGGKVLTSTQWANNTRSPLHVGMRFL